MKHYIPVFQKSLQMRIARTLGILIPYDEINAPLINRNNSRKKLNWINNLMKCQEKRKKKTGEKVLIKSEIHM